MPFEGSEVQLGEPLTHQVWELPLIAEHRRHRPLCPRCGAGRLAELPAGVSPRWVERICSVRETYRLQSRSVLGYLIEVASAAHSRAPAPSLVPP